MQFSKDLDEVIEAGWHVVHTEFDEQAYFFWKKKVDHFLSNFVGPDHTDARVPKDSIESIGKQQENGKPALMR